jgi:murein DD-endopeptidase MepM/ murein hydrolase activator NlpD
MLSRRYTIVVADRATGAVRTFTVPLRPVVVAFVLLFALPLLVGLGARMAGRFELHTLRAANESLELENASYRSATAELTTQISALQEAISDLAEKSSVDPAVGRAINSLPALVKNRAMGGAPGAVPAWLPTRVPGSPEDTFGMLRELLGVLEGRLNFVRPAVERWQALANATPSIWPARGWLSASFGNRADPFTGATTFHPALDISADRGQPIYATAAGTVQSASYSGAYGNLVEIAHGFGLTTRYGHMSRMAVRTGSTVKRGDVIGYVGATGRATGAHVHYEVWVNGRPINPLRLLLPRKN